MSYKKLSVIQLRNIKAEKRLGAVTAIFTRLGKANTFVIIVYHKPKRRRKRFEIKS